MKARLQELIYQIRYRVEVYICTLIGCSSVFATEHDWPHRFVCTPLSKKVYLTLKTSRGKEVTHLEFQHWADEAARLTDAELAEFYAEQWD